MVAKTILIVMAIVAIYLTIQEKRGDL